MTTTREQAEANIRKVMAARAQIPPDSVENRHLRAELLGVIDRMLGEWVEG